MTQAEHLNRIVAKCQKLIESATLSLDFFETPSVIFRLKCGIAGWRSTIAAIKHLRIIESLELTYCSNEYESGMNDAFGHASREAETALNTIRAAWPEELL